MNSIKSLQQNVGNSLRSSVILFDLPRVVEELVYNSVDAGANKVYVSVNLRACYVKVEDDGRGIIRDDLVILGERYATSKNHIPDDMEIKNKSFGFRGEALASLSDVSIVEIRTRARGMSHAYCKILKGSKCLYFGIDDKKEAVGTVVIVRDLFYNQPVRRNYMHTSPKRVLHAIKKYALRIALVQSHIQFKVTDITSEEELLCTEPSSSPLPLISDGFGQEVSSSLQEVVYSDKTLTLSGYISRFTNTFSTKAFQYIYINFRFVSKGPLHNLLNNLAVSCQCSSIQPEFQSGKRHKTQEYPAFLLNLHCPMSSYDLHFEPSKTAVEFKEWSAVLSFFKQSIKHFWNQVSEMPLERKTLSFANKRKLDATFPMESTTHEGVLVKNTKMKNVEYKSQPSENAHTGVGHKKMKPSDIMHSFSWLKPCQIKFEVNDEASYSSQHKIRDSLSTFSRLDYANDECDMPVYTEPSPDYFGHIEIDDVKNQFPSPCFSTLSPMEKNWSPLLGYGKCHSTTYAYLDGLDVNFDHTEKSSPSLNEVSLVGHTYFQEDDPIYRPTVSTIKNAYTSHDLDVSPKHMNTFSSDNVSLYMHSNFLASSKENCYLGSQQSLPVKRPREDIQSPNSVQHSSNDFFPSSGKRTQLKFYDKFNFERNLRYESPSVDQNTHEKVSSSAFSNETGWSPLGLCNMTNAVFYSKHEYQTSMQIRDEVRCLWDNLDIENPLTSKIQMVGLRRCSSAPPFYKAKHKFCTLTLTEPKAFNTKQETICSINGLSRSHPLSQQCVKTNGNDISQSFTRGGTDAKQITHDLGDFNGALNNHSKKDDLESALSTSSSQPYFKTIVDELPRKCFDVKISTRQIDGIQKIGESDKACVDQSSLSYSTDGTAGEDKEYSTTTKWRMGNQQHTVSDKSHISNDNVLSISSGLLHLSSDSLIPESISKECLENARVLLQLDHKFIPVIAGEILVVIDQHAADERIRLEELRHKVLSGEGTSVSYLESKQQLVLPEMGYQLLQKYEEQIQKWGWICNIQNEGSESFAKNVNLLRRRKCGISLIAVPCILGNNLSGGDLIEYVEQLVETDGSSNVPPSVNRILNSKACRGAIMFGDTLLHSECSLIVEELKATSLCFQCAHGRPTTVPVVNMLNLRKELEAILDTEEDDTYKVWHGLKRHKPSIERAQLRLESAERYWDSTLQNQGYSVLPWLTMAISANLGGWIADTLVSRGVSVTVVRKDLSAEDECNRGKCPLTPFEVGLLLRALGFGNETYIYVASWGIYGGEETMQPLKNWFPNLYTKRCLLGTI